VEPLLQTEVSSAARGTHISLWKNPVAWLIEKKLSRGFWIFFTAAFFFDFGFAVYYFLFNLYLLDMHFNERAMGLIGGASMLGSVAGTLPAGYFARKIGIRTLLIVCFVSAPILSVLRILIMHETAQIGLAFLTGLALCLWAVCFLPAVARLTTEQNRASAFSFIFSASVGTSALGGLLCGYLPQWLSSAGFVMQPADVKRLILLSSCGVAAIGLVAVLRLPLPQTEVRTDVRKKARWQFNPFLFRFLPAMALWTAALASFNPFVNVYLSRQLHIPLSRIGVVFSTAQVLQLCVGLLTPIVFRLLGLMNGVMATQFATVATLGLLAATSDARLAVALYLGFSTLQWMSSPLLNTLLMNRVPDEDRSTAAAMMMFCNALLGSGATAIAGSLFVSFGYPRVLVGIAILAGVAAGLFRLLVGKNERDYRSPSAP
jgi:MFS family permease